MCVVTVLVAVAHACRTPVPSLSPMSLFDPDVGRAPEPTWSVGELADAVGNVLRASFSDEVWVRGEVHDLSRPPSGHVYFTLVEDRPDGGRASLAVMLSARSRPAVNRTLTEAGGTVRIVDGTEVRIRGRLDWYAPRGQVQLRMTAIDPAHTLGQLEMARAELLGRLRSEGLLEANGQRPLPLVPLTIGLVTSRGSAAEADFLHELAASGLAFRVLPVDVRVQGVGAAVAVAAGVRSASAAGAEVVAVVRGGGARTDLATFDDERVARAVAACSVPVLTGIGHEVDRSVADEVAHTAAKTPTACAALLVERVGAYLHRFEAGWVDVARATARAMAAHDRRLHGHGVRASRSTRAAVHAAADRLDDHAGRARRAGTVALARADARLERDAGRVTGAARSHLRSAAGSVDAAGRRLAGRAPRALAEADRALDGVQARVRALDPSRVLARGWSITRTADGTVVRAPDQVAAGDRLVTLLSGGEVRSTVDSEEVTPDA
jgi:exodeoxyribonuclease VII large subunit